MTTAPPGPVASTAKSAGTVITGAIVSCTVTLKVLLPVFVPSVAEQVTSVEPMAKVESLAGTQVTGGAPATASVAEAEKVTTAPLGPVASAACPPGP